MVWNIILKVTTIFLTRGFLLQKITCEANPGRLFFTVLHSSQIKLTPRFLTA